MQTETKATIENMNRVIAEFMGFTRYSGNWYSKDRKYTKLEFHDSWAWLMPVVEKISKMPLLNVDNTPCTDIIDTCYPITFNMPTEDGRVMFRFKGFSLHTDDKLIDAVHAAVYEVAQYHNSTTPPEGKG
jgi:hypothetical protein